MIQILAYGGFSGDEAKDIGKIISLIIPSLFITWLFCFGLYFFSKKKKKLMFITVPLYVTFMIFYIPSIGAMGEDGPYHIGTELIRKSLALSALFVLTIPLFIFVESKLKKKKVEQDNREEFDPSLRDISNPSS